MSDDDRAFIERQRTRLVALRTHLLGEEREGEASEKAVQENYGDEARQYEDEGQRLQQVEIDEGLHVAGDRRLRAIDRALAKIDEGSYGLSDLSGDPIPRARLEAVPEAFLTVEEEAARDRED
ncbi:MAG TPA: hypothetical protein VNZ43_12585 [Sphingomonadaceae bacterium]|nr:hypothetical protein [Sphingomonadaceae bacterium]